MCGGREGKEERETEMETRRNRKKVRDRKGVETDKRLFGSECVSALNIGWRYYHFLLKFTQ